MWLSGLNSVIFGLVVLIILEVLYFIIIGLFVEGLMFCWFFRFCGLIVIVLILIKRLCFLGMDGWGSDKFLIMDVFFLGC